jgi:hypothetical protein
LDKASLVYYIYINNTSKKTTQAYNNYNNTYFMSGQHSDGGVGTAESSSASGCSLSERLRPRIRKAPDLEGLAVFSWGRGEDGQLGLGDTSDQDEPTYVDALRGVGVRQIACGSGHTVVLTTEGEVFTWVRFLMNF